jgi:hypothetical protein
VEARRENSLLDGGMLCVTHKNAASGIISLTSLLLSLPRYSILAMTAILMLMSFVVSATRGKAEGFMSIWSGMLLVILCIGGTLIMRKFHNSMAVGFFMGGVVATSQMFFLLFLLYVESREKETYNAAEGCAVRSDIAAFSFHFRYTGYGKDQRLQNESSKEEMLMALFSFLQSLLLGSFAAILGAHRSEILDKNMNTTGSMMEEETVDSRAYDPPSDSVI